MSRVWFTADLHLGHQNIIRHCQRPFGTVGEMDAALIANWNAVVQPQDDIWVLGDFAFRSARSADDYLRRLNGRKHLIGGNHDSEAARASSGWASSQVYAEVSVDGQRLVLFHYSLRVWNGSSRGVIHLYGHSHGRLPGDAQSLDVGVDAWDYRPVGLKEIRQRLAESADRSEPDHDGGEP